MGGARLVGLATARMAMAKQKLPDTRTKATSVIGNMMTPLQTISDEVIFLLFGETFAPFSPLLFPSY